ncbi:6-bladed beta-propeller [Gemmatimonadota bacterium]
MLRIMETFTKPREFVDNPHYEVERNRELRNLSLENVDLPIRETVAGFAELPYCFTLQSCFGHFVYNEQQAPDNLDPLPEHDVGPVTYRLAYVAFCLQDSAEGRRLLFSLAEFPSIDPEYVQFGSPGWFWNRHLNTFAIQVEPIRFALASHNTLPVKLQRLYRSKAVIPADQRNLTLYHPFGEVPAMKLRLMIICTLAALCCMAACSSKESPDHSFTVIEEDGVPVALSSGGPKYLQPIFTYEELFRLDQDESREETLLGDAGSPCLDAEGNVYVGDSQNNRIAVFDNQGHYLRSFGREGSGSGEFRVLSLRGIIDGQVVVSDFQNWRLSIFTTEGEFLRSVAYPRSTARPPLFYMTFGAYPIHGNRLVLVQQGLTTVGDVTGSAFRAGVHSEIGESLAEVISPPAPPPGSFRGAPILQYIHGRGILHVKCPEPEMEWYDLDGSLREVYRLDIARDQVTAADRDRVRSELRTVLESYPEGAQRIWAQQELDELAFPDEKDVWFSTQADESGYLWASEPSGSSHSPIHLQKWRVLSPEGEYLGDTWFPEVTGSNTRGNPSRGCLIMTWEDEETGAPVVAVYRVRSAIHGFTYP